MQRSFLKTWIIAALLLALGALSGCTTLRLAYNSAPELSYLWLDNFVDFNEEQAPRVRDALGNWFRWHRSTQLADYAALLARAQVQVSETATPAQMCRWTEDFNARMGAVIEQAVPAMAELASTLTPSQLRRMERRYAKRDEEFRTEFLGPAKERDEKAVKRVVERAEILYGALDEAQRERIAASLATSPFAAQVWFAERKARQQDMLATLRLLIAERSAPSGAKLDASEPVVRALLQRIERSPRPAYRAYQQRLQQYNCALAAEIHNLTTPAQRQVALTRLRGWETDLRSLAADQRFTVPTTGSKRGAD